MNIQVTDIQSAIERTVYTYSKRRRIKRIRFETIHFSKYDKETSLKINIDNDWSVSDFETSFFALKNLYYYYFTRELITELLKINPDYPKEIVILESNYYNINYRHTYNSFTKNNPELKYYLIGQLSRYYEIVESKFPLKVNKIIYASPGFKDIAGLGEAIKHIKDIILTLVNHHLSRERRKEEIRELKIKNDQEEVELELMKIKKNKEYIDLLKKCQFDDDQIKEILLIESQSSQILYDQIKNGRIGP